MEGIAINRSDPFIAVPVAKDPIVFVVDGAFLRPSGVTAVAVTILLISFTAFVVSFLVSRPPPGTKDVPGPWGEFLPQSKILRKHV